MKAVRSFKIGNYRIQSHDGHIVEIKITSEKANDVTNDAIEQCVKELNEYFDGKRKTFDFPMKYISGTPFQQEVWNTLLEIPYGETISYKTLASRVRTENHSRAVANANGKNPISIAIPCHRVIASSGEIGGYSSGVEIKEQLLSLEKASCKI